MKKAVLILGIFFIMAFATACGSTKEDVTVANGTYIFEGSSDMSAPIVTITENEFTFIYDPLSDYMSYGTYTVDGSTITMETSDGLYHYVFEAEDETLIFQKDDSSSVSMTDDQQYEELEDQAEFELGEEESFTIF